MGSPPAREPAGDPWPGPYVHSRRGPGRVGRARTRAYVYNYTHVFYLKLALVNIQRAGPASSPEPIYMHTFLHSCMISNDCMIITN